MTTISRSEFVTRLFYDELEQEAKDEMNAHYTSSIHAGGIMDCQRKTGFHLYNLKDSWSDPVGMVHMKMGIRWHEFIQATLKKTGKIQSIEKKMPRLANIVGIADVLVDDGGERPVPIEVKPLTEQRFNKISEPNNYHVGQLMMYMHWAKADHGYIFYYNKNISHWRFDVFARMPFFEFRVEYDEAMVKAFIKKAEFIWSYFEKHELPPIPDEFGPKFCSYCAFYPTKCLRGIDYIKERYDAMGEEWPPVKRDKHVQKQ